MERIRNSADWPYLNEVLLDGEVGVERETGKRKVGNGIDVWTDLSYVNMDVLEIASQAETDAGVIDTKAISPLKLKNALKSLWISEINVRQLGIIPDGVTDYTSALAAAISSNTVLFLPKGVYVVNNLTINGVSGLCIYGEEGTVLTTSGNKILAVTGNIENLEIYKIKFQSTRVQSTQDTEGLIFVSIYNSNIVMDGICIHHCEFTNRETNCNAVKIISEGSNSLIKNVVIERNRFIGIGRMGVETQNHLNDAIARITNLDISNNFFNDIGTIQNSSVAVAAVSISGYSLDCKVNFNHIEEMRMDTTTHVYYGIENAGCIGMEVIGNLFRSSVYGFIGILASGPGETDIAAGNPRKHSMIISNNIFGLDGPPGNLNRIRGMELNNLNNSIISENTIVTRGYAARIYNCSFNKIANNICISKADNVLFLTQNSKENEIYQNVLNNSGFGSNNIQIQFNGNGTSGNIVYLNRYVQFTGLGGGAGDSDGASNNDKLNVTNGSIRLHSDANYVYPLSVSTGGGNMLRFGDRGSSIGALNSQGNVINLEIQGGLYIDGNTELNQEKGIILKSQNGTRIMLTATNAGTLNVTTL